MYIYIYPSINDYFVFYTNFFKLILLFCLVFFFSILRFSLTRQRCASCTSELEVDRKVVPKGFFLSIVSTPTGATVFIVFVLVVVYQCGGFTNNILFHGASCTFKDACPQYKRWHKLCKRTKQNYRYFKKQMKRIQRNVTQKYHTINEYDEQDKNNNDDGESESGSENKSENENDENVRGDDVEVGM